MKFIPRRFLSLTLLALIVLAAVIVPASAAPQQQPPMAGLLARERISTVDNKNELPYATIAGTQLYATWQSRHPRALSLTKLREAPESGGGWSSEGTHGAGGDGTYHTSSVAVSPLDGTLHLVYADGSQGHVGQVYHKRRNPDGSWTGAMRISSSNSFTTAPHAVVDAHGRVWAIWAVQTEKVASVYARYSADRGQTWSIEYLLSDREAKQPWIAADRSGGVHAFWYSKDAYLAYGYSTGAGFAVDALPIPPQNFGPTATVDQNNTLHLVWRRQTTWPNYDIYYMYKPAGGGWSSPQKLISLGDMKYAPVIYADNANVLHLLWGDPAAPDSEIWYTYKYPESQWAPPVNISNDNINQFGLDVVGYSDLASARGHIFVESWYGDEFDARIEHLTTVASTPFVQAWPKIEGGARYSTRATNIGVTFDSVNGNPDQVRYRWHSPPDDSNPWLGFASTISVPNAPPEVNDWSCQTHVLFTQVRNSSIGVTEAEPKGDLITFDLKMQATAQIALAPGAVAPQTGDPNWTRSRSLRYRVFGEPADCSDIAHYIAPNTDDTTHQGSDRSWKTVTMQTAGWSNEGYGLAERDMVARVRITDGVGHVGTIERTFHYDDDPPLIVAGALAASNGPSNSGSLARLFLNNLQVTDDSYGAAIGQPNKAYWGVWLLVSNTNLGSAPSADVFRNRGAEVRRLSPGQTTFVTPLISGDADPGKAPGTRYIYIRFLDAAGNFSNQVLSASINLAEDYGSTTPYLPQVLR